MDKQKYHFGIKEIDQDHDKLFIIIEKLKTAIGNHQEGPVLEEVFYQLLDYAQPHFLQEETLFSQYNYPMADEHKLHHQELIQRLINCIPKINTHECDEILAQEMVTFLDSWAAHHMTHVEPTFIELIKQNNLSL